MDRSPEQHARDLAEAVLAATDRLLEESVWLSPTERTSFLIALRVRARDVLGDLPLLTEDERRAAALRVERWGALARRQRVQDAPGSI